MRLPLAHSNHELQAGAMGGSAGTCGVPYHQRFRMPAEDASREGTANLWWKLELGPVLRLFPPHAPSSHAQGSSGVVGNMPFA